VYVLLKLHFPIHAYILQKLLPLLLLSIFVHLTSFSSHRGLGHVLPENFSPLLKQTVSSIVKIIENHN